MCYVEKESNMPAEFPEKLKRNEHRRDLKINNMLNIMDTAQ